MHFLARLSESLSGALPKPAARPLVNAAVKISVKTG